MTLLRAFFGAALILALGACASSPPVHYYSLDDGQPREVGSPTGLRVAVTQVNLPDVVDRPQLVIRSIGHQLRLDDQHEWAEPLRRQIPRLVARDLAGVLDSGRVVALPIDAQDYQLDFKVMLDIQRMEVVAGQGVDLDVVWRVEARNGDVFFGRSLVRKPIETAAASSDYQAAVAAQNLALQTVAANIAAGITDWLDQAAADGHSADRSAVPAAPSTRRGRGDGI